MPVIPMWSGVTTVVWSDNVAEMVHDGITDVDYGQITMNN